MGMKGLGVTFRLSGLSVVPFPTSCLLQGWAWVPGPLGSGSAGRSLLAPEHPVLRVLGRAASIPPSCPLTSHGQHLLRSWPHTSPPGGVWSLAALMIVQGRRRWCQSLPAAALWQAPDGARRSPFAASAAPSGAQVGTAEPGCCRGWGVFWSGVGAQGNPGGPTQVSGCAGAELGESGAEFQAVCIFRWGC